MRRLDGWEPKSVTEYEYDEAGLLVRAVTTREPEWDDEQEAWMLALAEWRNGYCPSCGLRREDCMAIENDGKFVATPMRCHATTARIIEAERYKDNPQPDALLYGVELRR